MLWRDSTVRAPRGTLGPSRRPGPPPGPVNTRSSRSLPGGSWRRIASTTNGAAGLIDQVVAYIAPVLIGGGGKPALAGPGALNIADAKRFQLDDVVRVGPDVRLTATPLR